jgi:4-carboxymuconolactone decarboxylase
MPPTTSMTSMTSMTGPPQDRMPPIPKDQWTDAQKKAAAEFAAARKQEVFGPFAVMLRSPEVMLRAMAMGDYMRYRTVLPPPLNEFIIIITARHWTQQFEWQVHQPAALNAGLPPAIVKAVAEGRRPDDMSEEEASVHDFTVELLRSRNVSDPVYAKAVARFGEQGVIDMVGVAAYYSFLSMMMNTARTAVPVHSAVPALVPLST